MRLFFALELSSEAKLDVANWRDNAFRGLQATGDAKAVPPDNFHITLAFLGPIAEQTLERLCGAVDQWLAHRQLPGGTLAMEQVGCWPNSGILWLGPQHTPQTLSELVGALQTIGTQFGARRDKKTYQPHVTLFRHCHQAPPPLQEPKIIIDYRGFTLFESRQHRGRVSYAAVAQWS